MWDVKVSQKMDPRSRSESNSVATRTRCVGVCTYCLAKNVESKVSWVTESPLPPCGSMEVVGW
ncbi:hypothetical protein K0M31_012369 [Melipona bicolor]|uniref:Uncharacterized protein n=1 Tax=Melipona bicolor TaxID=60889 RepID=A0AA40FKK6_9HYME|nr:hypothetical protein K0M31_012369 [Melipona bicolor]